MIKTGNLVVARGHEGIYRVYAISEDGKTAEIERFITSSRQPISDKISVPSDTLSRVKEDASQAAARIVREATEK